MPHAPGFHGNRCSVQTVGGVWSMQLHLYVVHNAMRSLSTIETAGPLDILINEFLSMLHGSIGCHCLLDRHVLHSSIVHVARGQSRQEEVPCQLSILGKTERAEYRVQRSVKDKMGVSLAHPPFRLGLVSPPFCCPAT